MVTQKSKIEWTETTWNPCRGCSPASAGCLNCYAVRIARRFGGPGKPYDGLTKPSNGHGPRWTGNIRLVREVLDAPLRWSKPRMVFVNSMSDLFHDAVPASFISDVFDVMARSSKHTFQVLTKRSERLREMAPDLPWPGNIWMGVTAESADYLNRVADLITVPAAVRFLSIEPMLGPMDELDLAGIQWVIVGGESGPGARAIEPAWVRTIRDQCVESEVAFFFKQWGGVRKKAAGRLLDGKTWSQLPITQQANRGDIQ